MPTSTWGDPESYADETYPSALLKYLLKQMIAHFAAQGACIALFDESIGQMRISMNLRLSSGSLASSPLNRASHDGRGPSHRDDLRPQVIPGGSSSRRLSTHLENDIATPGQESGPLPLIEEIQELS